MTVTKPYLHATTNSTTIMSTDISTEELDRIYTFAVQLGKDAGQMLLEAAEARYSGSAQTHIEKDSAVDIVTQTDEGQSFRSSVIFRRHHKVWKKTCLILS